MFVSSIQLWCFYSSIVFHLRHGRHMKLSSVASICSMKCWNYEYVTVKAINLPAFSKSYLFLHYLRRKQALPFGQDNRFEYHLLVCKIQRSAFYTRYAPLVQRRHFPQRFPKRYSNITFNTFWKNL